MKIKIVKDIDVCGFKIKKGAKITVHTDIISVHTIKDNKFYCYPIIPRGIGRTLDEVIKEINNQNQP